MSLPFQKIPLIRDTRYLRVIRKMKCTTCGRKPPSEAAHVRMMSLLHNKPQTGLGRKPGDNWTVPLCHRCHMAQHTHGEREWWEAQRLDPLEIARNHWMAYNGRAT